MKNMGLLFCLIVFLVSMTTPTCLVFADDTDLPKYLDVQGDTIISEGGKVCFNITNMIDKPIDVTVIVPFDFSVISFRLPPKESGSFTEYAPSNIESFYEVYNFQFDVTSVIGSEHIDFPVYVVDSVLMSILDIYKESLRAELEEPTQKISVSIVVFGLSLVSIFIIGFLLGIIICKMRVREKPEWLEQEKKKE